MSLSKHLSSLVRQTATLHARERDVLATSLLIFSGDGINFNIVVALRQLYCIDSVFCQEGVNFIWVGCFLLQLMFCFDLLGFTDFPLLKLLAVSEILTSVGCFVEININEMAADSIVRVETNAFIKNGI